MKKINIACSCKMGPGTFEAKFIPISMIESVHKIIVVRKEPGPQIDKVIYRVLPKICVYPLMNLVIASIILAYEAAKHKADFLLAYHYVPHYYIVYFASLLSHKPYVLGQTGRDEQNIVITPAGKFLLHIIRSAYSLNVPGSSSLEFWQKLRVKNVRILHSTIDTERFKPSSGEKIYDFLYLGRLESYKGVHYIIQAFAEIVTRQPNASLAIVGYGSYEDYLKDLVKKHSLDNNISFHGFHADTFTFYSKAKAFVMASETEGLPCALMEAMCCELICISSLVGDIGDILINGLTGFTFSSGDVNGLTSILEDVYKNSQKYDEIRKRARQLIVEKHSYHSAISSWDGILRQDANLD